MAIKGKPVFMLMILAFSFNLGYAQTINVDNGGDGTWDDTDTYTTANIPDNVNENVSFNNNRGTVELETGQSYTVGDVSTANGNTLTVNGTLNVGNSTNAKDYSSGNSGNLNVHGTVIIWGNLDVNNDYTLNVTGTLIIKGDIVLSNNGTLTISGDVTVEGDFIGGNDTTIDIDGNMDVGGDFSVGSNSTATGSGSITYGGSCTDSASGVCSSGPLPVSLVEFSAKLDNNQVTVSWSTATEENNDFYTIEKSADGIFYEAVGNVKGAGNSTSLLSYSWVDQMPSFGRSYYRLVQTDFDGTSETFAPVSVYRSTLTGVTLAPNPVQSGRELKIFHDATYGESVNVQIVSVTGAIVVNEILDSTASVEIPADVKTGLYIVKLQSGHNQYVKRLIVK